MKIGRSLMRRRASARVGLSSHRCQTVWFSWQLSILTSEYFTWANPYYTQIYRAYPSFYIVVLAMTGAER